MNMEDGLINKERLVDSSLSLLLKVFLELQKYVLKLIPF